MQPLILVVNMDHKENLRLEVIDLHFGLHENRKYGKIPLFPSTDIFSHFLLTHISFADIRWDHRFFWCSDSILRPLFNLRWSWRSWPPEINDLWRSKYEIYENGSCEVSNHRFFGVPISFITWDGPEISMTSGGQNIKSMKISHVRYRITGFLVFRFYSETHFWLRWSWRSWPPDINDLWRSKYEINENGSCEVSNHRFFGVPIPFWDPFLSGFRWVRTGYCGVHGRMAFPPSLEGILEISTSR